MLGNVKTWKFAPRLSEKHIFTTPRHTKTLSKSTIPGEWSFHVHFQHLANGLRDPTRGILAPKLEGPGRQKSTINLKKSILGALTPPSTPRDTDKKSSWASKKSSWPPGPLQDPPGTPPRPPPDPSQSPPGPQKPSKINSKCVHNQVNIIDSTKHYFSITSS